MGLGLELGLRLGLELGLGLGLGSGLGSYGGRRLLSTVVRYCTIDVVRDVRGADAVVKPVYQRRVGPVDGEECTTPGSKPRLVWLASAARAAY